MQFNTACLIEPLLHIVKACVVGLQDDRLSCTQRKREGVGESCSKWLQIFLHSPEICPRKTQAVSGSALQHHVMPFLSPPPYQRGCFFLLHSTPIFSNLRKKKIRSFCCVKSTVSLQELIHIFLTFEVFNVCEIHNIFFFIVDSKGIIRVFPNLPRPFSEGWI